MKKAKKVQEPQETKEIFKPKSNSKKYLWIALLVLVILAGGFFFWQKKPTIAYKQAYVVTKQDIKQSVIATGTVLSETNLNLSFKTSGIVAKINIKPGDKVKAGQTLAALDAKDASAQVAVATAGVKAAQVALNNAKNNAAIVVSQQQTLVDNAYATMLSSGLTAVPDNPSSVTVTISGTYTGKDMGSYKITTYPSGDGQHLRFSGLESGDTGKINDNIPLALGTRGLFITFSSSSLQSFWTWTVNIPNTQASSYITNSNAYQSALQTQNQQVTSSKGAIDTAAASLDQAKAQLTVAENSYSNNLIESPISGVVTAVDTKLGEQAVASKEVIVVLDPKSLHVETEIPESSINQINPGQEIDMTFDALGPEKHLSGQVLSIDPASTVNSGVIDFRVISSLPSDPSIKPGMTVNLAIKIFEKPQVLAVPNRLISTVDGKKYLTVMENGQVKKTEIQIGVVGDNFTEVASGVTVGTILVSEIK